MIEKLKIIRTVIKSYGNSVSPKVEESSDKNNLVDLHPLHQNIFRGCAQPSFHSTVSISRTSLTQHFLVLVKKGLSKDYLFKESSFSKAWYSRRMKRKWRLTLVTRV